MHENIYEPKKTLVISKKLLRDAMIMARKQQQEALEVRNQVRYMFYGGFESALKHLTLLTEDKE